MTSRQAYDMLPTNAEWSCCFGNPGECNFSDRFRTPDGTRYEIRNERGYGYAYDVNGWSFAQVKA